MVPKRVVSPSAIDNASMLRPLRGFRATGSAESGLWRSLVCVLEQLFTRPVCYSSDIKRCIEIKLT